jgi:hypothetical protein
MTALEIESITSSQNPLERSSLSRMGISRPMGSTVKISEVDMSVEKGRISSQECHQLQEEMINPLERQPIMIPLLHKWGKYSLIDLDSIRPTDTSRPWRPSIQPMEPSPRRDSIKITMGSSRRVPIVWRISKPNEFKSDFIILLQQRKKSDLPLV